MSGALVAFEGIDGSGKSTQARRAAQRFNALYTFEPGGSELGAQLRTWLLDRRTQMEPPTEALLMLADRSHHVATVIEPALARGERVICDRYAASTYAYQGYGRGLDLDLLRSTTELASRGRRADLTILLDVPLDIARSRRPVDDADRYESSGSEYLERVRHGYLELAHGDSTWRVIDGTSAQASVDVEVDRVLTEFGWS